MGPSSKQCAEVYSVLKASTVKLRHNHGISMTLSIMFCTQDLIDDVPLYVNAKEVCRADGSVEALELNYM